MKPESIKSILYSYLKEKEYSSHSDDVDGKWVAESGSMAGEGFDAYQDRCSDLFFMEPENAAVAFEEYYAPLDPENQEVVQRIGRQLSNLSDDFEADHVDPIKNISAAFGNKTVEFKRCYEYAACTSDRIEIPVVRMGDSDGTAKVGWRTCDKTAAAGTHYVSGTGNISFADGETEKTLEVKLIGTHTDINFTVELCHPEEIALGSVNSVTVYIVDHSKLYDDEKQVVENILNIGRDVSISNLLSCMADKVTNNTFKAALQCICSSADTIPKELAFGAELLRVTVQHRLLSISSVTNVFCSFFSHLPELEEISTMFD